VLEGAAMAELRHPMFGGKAYRGIDVLGGDETTALVLAAAGLVLHGGTEVKERRGLVTRFQDDESVPFFVLS